MNTVSLTGRLASDVESRTVNVGGEDVVVSEFRVAVRKTKDSAHFIDVKAWRQPGEAAAKYLTKGAYVALSGRLEQETWVDKETEANRSKIVVVALDLDLGPKVDSDESQSKPKKSPKKKKAAQVEDEDEDDLFG